jgi:hypothetical protein
VHMRETVAANNVYGWAARFVTALATLRMSAARGSHSAGRRFTDIEVA